MGSPSTAETDGVDPMTGATREESLSVLQRRWRKFKTLRRGWYSFLALIALYVISIFNPLIINNRALVVSYEGDLYYPAVAEWLGNKTP